MYEFEMYAFQLGVEAFKNGRRRTHNPYKAADELDLADSWDWCWTHMRDSQRLLAAEETMIAWR